MFESWITQPWPDQFWSVSTRWCYSHFREQRLLVLEGEKKCILHFNHKFSWSTVSTHQFTPKLYSSILSSGYSKWGILHIWQKRFHPRWPPSYFTLRVIKPVWQHTSSASLQYQLSSLSLLSSAGDIIYGILTSELSELFPAYVCSGQAGQMPKNPTSFSWKLKQLFW